MIALDEWERRNEGSKVVVYSRATVPVTRLVFPSPPPCITTSNVRAAGIREMTSSEFFGGIIEKMRGVAFQDQKPCSVCILDLMNNPEPPGPHPKPVAPYDHQKTMGHCAFCWELILADPSDQDNPDRKPKIKAADCNRCIYHPECSAYMRKRGRWPALFCVTRTWRFQKNGMTPQCANRITKTSKPKAENTKLTKITHAINKAHHYFTKSGYSYTVT